MVQAADDRQRNNASGALDGSRQRRVFGQGQVCSDAVVVMCIRAQHMAQMALAEHDHMIEALAPDRADQSLGMTVLPRRSWRSRSVANAHRSKPTGICLAVDAVPITKQISRRGVPAAGFTNLQSDPFGIRMCGDAKPEDASPGVAQHE